MTILGAHVWTPPDPLRPTHLVLVIGRTLCGAPLEVDGRYTGGVEYDGKSVWTTKDRLTGDGPRQPCMPCRAAFYEVVRARMVWERSG